MSCESSTSRTGSPEVSRSPHRAGAPALTTLHTTDAETLAQRRVAACGAALLVSLLCAGAAGCSASKDPPPPDLAPLDQRSPAGDRTTLDLVAADRGSQGDGCGYRGTGASIQVTGAIELCMPQVVCTAETCPPPLGQCVGGRCEFKAGYRGIETLPEAWATHYCALAAGGCHGVTQINFPEITAAAVGQSLGLPLCDGGQDLFAGCVGVAASSPMLVGNSQEAVDPTTGVMVPLWGLGLTEASGLCYELHGPGGRVIVALTDRCGGYCRCGGSEVQECGPCVSAEDMEPHCACVGAVPGLFEECCGRGCPSLQPDCDWCASNNHPHFDLDTAAFNALCGAEAIQGSCRLTSARFISCLQPDEGWPPGGSGAACKAGSFWCAGPEPHHLLVPGSTCCCNWDLQPQPDGTCA